MSSQSTATTSKGSSSPIPANSAIHQVYDRIRERIARRAYDLYQQDGNQPGRDMRHWLQAESEILTDVPEIRESVYSSSRLVTLCLSEVVFPTGDKFQWGDVGEGLVWSDAVVGFLPAAQLTVSLPSADTAGVARECARPILPSTSAGAPGVADASALPKWSDHGGRSAASSDRKSAG